MNKILVVARNEYLIAITSKAFLVGLFMMPLLMGGAFLVQYMARDQVDLTPRKLAVVDQTGRLGKVIQQQADARNRDQIFAGEGPERHQTQAVFHVELLSPADAGAEDLLITQSDRVRQGDIFAFAVIDDSVFDTSGTGVIHYHSQSPSYRTLSNWLRQVVSQEIKQTRIKELNLSRESVAALSSETVLRQFGLVHQDLDEDATDAKEENRVLMFVRIAIPPGPAAWEVVLGTILVIAFAGGCVWAAGKIFRIGILSQGQPPTLAGLVKWLVAK